MSAFKVIIVERTPSTETEPIVTECVDIPTVEPRRSARGPAAITECVDVITTEARAAHDGSEDERARVRGAGAISPLAR